MTLKESCTVYYACRSFNQSSWFILLDERTLTRRRADHDDPTADLTPSERKVLELIGDGLSNREIGAKLGVAEKTVKNHITSLLSKMGLQRRTQVAAWVAGQRAAAWRN